MVGMLEHHLCRLLLCHSDQDVDAHTHTHTHTHMSCLLLDSLIPIIQSRGLAPRRGLDTT